MPRWMAFLFRFIGLVNIVLCSAGLYYLLESVVFWRTPPIQDPGQPYFYYAFFAMGAINLAFIALLSQDALDLLRLSLAGAKRYMWIVLSLIGHDLIGAMCWLLPHRLGMSIAGATGVGNMGIAPFEFALFFLPFGRPLLSVPLGYPVISAAALYFSCRRLAGFSAAH